MLTYGGCRDARVLGGHAQAVVQLAHIGLWDIDDSIFIAGGLDGAVPAQRGRDTGLEAIPVNDMITGPKCQASRWKFLKAGILRMCLSHL